MTMQTLRIRRHRRAGHHREGDARLRGQPGDLQGQARRDEARDQVGDRGLFKVKVKAVNTIVRKGKQRTFKGIKALLSDTKRAIVTLEDGHSIDVTTGL